MILLYIVLALFAVYVVITGTILSLVLIDAKKSADTNLAKSLLPIVLIGTLFWPIVLAAYIKQIMVDLRDAVKRKYLLWKES